MIKVFTFVLAAFFLTACGAAPTQPDETAPNVIDASNAGSESVNPDQVSQIGELCGPNTQKICASGLSCKFSNQQSDQGLCVQKVVDTEIECGQEQKPVCGLLGDNKNGYLNECEAKRHGAVVVSQGFCKPDPTVIGNCEARAYSIGNCQNTFNGAKFDTTNGCEAVTLVGCEADLPFKTLSECQTSCA